MVARSVRDAEAAGSSPAFPTRPGRGELVGLGVAGQFRDPWKHAGTAKGGHAAAPIAFSASRRSRQSCMSTILLSRTRRTWNSSAVSRPSGRRHCRPTTRPASVCATNCARESTISPRTMPCARCWRTDRTSSGPCQLGVRRHQRCPLVTPRHSRLSSSKSTKGSTSPPTAASKAAWMRSASLGIGRLLVHPHLLA